MKRIQTHCSFIVAARSFAHAALAAVAPTIGLSSCDGLTDPVHIGSVQIRGDDHLRSMVGQTVKLEAVVTNEDGKILDDPEIVWTSTTSSPHAIC